MICPHCQKPITLGLNQRLDALKYKKTCGTLECVTKERQQTKARRGLPSQGNPDKEAWWTPTAPNTFTPEAFTNNVHHRSTYRPAPPRQQTITLTKSVAADL